MLKKKFSLIVIIAIIVLSLVTPISRAENESAEQTTQNTQTEEQIQEAEKISNDAENSNQSINYNNMKKEDVYIMDNDVTIDNIVDGNLFIIANNVTINSQIGGDAFIIAKNINVTKQGYIYSNLFACTQDLKISGIVYDLYTTSQNITIDGYIYRDIRVSTNDLNINGLIGRNAYVLANNIKFAETSTEENSTITNNAIINGNLNYSSPHEVSMPSDKTVSGDVNFTSMPQYNSNTIQNYILSFGQFVVTVIIIWLLCLWIAPKFLKNTTELLSKRLLPVIGFGILTPIVIGIAFIALLLLGITSKIALLGLGLLILLLAISSSIFIITINRIICEKLKIEKSLQTLGMLIISSTVIWFLTLIPYAGTFLNLIFSILGLGIVITNVIPTKKKSKS